MQEWSIFLYFTCPNLEIKKKVLQNPYMPILNHYIVKNYINASVAPSL